MAPPPEYYSHIRTDVLSLIGGRGQRVLELGCAEGRLGEALKAQGIASHVTGIERDARAAAEARKRLDDVLEADLEQGLPPLPAASFDVAVTADVLEHLRDPYRVVAGIHAALRPGGRLVVSVPNIKYLKVLAGLILHDDFTYQEWGVLDRTHLTFFTASTARSMLTAQGMVVDRVVYKPPIAWKLRLLNVLTLGLFPSFFAEQILLTAHRA